MSVSLTVLSRLTAVRFPLAFALVLALCVGCDEATEAGADGSAAASTPGEESPAGEVGSIDAGNAPGTGGTPRVSPPPDGGAPSTSVPTTLAETEFCAAYAQATCEVSDACCTAAFDVGACLNYVKDACEQAYGQSSWAYDGVKAASCVAEIRGIAPACTTITLQTDPSACEGVRVNPSTNGAGTSCSVSAGNCASGLLCLQAADKTWSCQPPRQLGESCRLGSDCKAGLYCDTTVTPASARTCKVKKTLGEACTSYSECLSDQCAGMPRQCLSAEASFCGLGARR